MIRSLATGAARLGWAAVLWGTWLAANAPAAENAAALEFLAKQGLTREGNNWLSPVEAKVKGYFEGLRDLERDCLAAQKALDAGLRENQALQTQVARLEEELKQLNDLLQSGTLNRSQGERYQTLAQQRADQINQLKPQLIDPAGLDEGPAVKAAVVRAIEARNALALAVLYLRAHATEVESSYAPLTANKDVQDALTALGGKHKLGPLKQYDKDLKRIDRLEKLVFTESVPAYRDNTLPRISAIVNEQAAATFTYGEQVAATYLPQSVATAAGLTIPDDAPRVDVLAEGNRKIAARAVKIPKLRFGKQVLEDFEALILAPDAEDMGAVLSPRSFGAWKPVVDIAQLEFRVLPPTGDHPSDEARSGKPKRAVRPSKR